MKKIIQILILLIPFIFLVFIISCSNNSNNQFSEFKLEKDLKKIELYLKEKDLILVEHRRTSNQQFTPSESELLEPVLKIINFPSININSECLDVGTDIREAFNNYPIFVLSKEVKFPNSTGIVSANKNLIPVILLDDLLKYLGC